MEYVENLALSEFENPPRVWKRYVDNTFAVINREFLDQVFVFSSGIQSSIELTKLIAFFGCKSNKHGHG